MSASEAPRAAQRQPKRVEPSTVCSQCGAASDPRSLEMIDGKLVCDSCALILAAEEHRTIATFAPSAQRGVTPPAKKGLTVWIAAASLAVVAGAIAIVLMRGGETPSHAEASTAAPVSAALVAPSTSDQPASTAMTPAIVASKPPGAGTLVASLLEAANKSRAQGDPSSAARYQAVLDAAFKARGGEDDLIVRQQVQQAKIALASLQAGSPSNPMPATTPPSAPDPDSIASASPPARVTPSIRHDADSKTSPWETEHGNELDQLLQAAEAAVAGPPKMQALVACSQVMDFLQGHRQEIRDETRRQRIARIAESRGKLLAALRDSDESRTMTITVSLDVGVRALGLGKWKTGFDSLSDARRLLESHLKPAERATDENYLTVLNGLAAAYVNLQKVPKAGELFDDAAPLGRATNARPNRELIWNRSVVDMIQKHRVMRGVKGLKEFMEVNNNLVDEDLTNLFGTALAIAAEHGQSDNRFLESCEKYYYACNERLESTRPGEKRWGVKWMQADEAARIFQQRDMAMGVWKQRMNDVASAAAHLKQVQADAVPHIGFGGMHRSATEADVQSARSALAERQRAANEAWAQVPRPPWLETFKPVVPHWQAAAPPTAVASAQPSVSEPTFPSPPDPASPEPRPKESPAPPPSIAPAPPVPVPEHRLARYAVAFPVDAVHLVTSADDIGSASTVRMEDSGGNVIDARVVARQDRLALLEIDAAAAGGTQRYFNLAASFTGGKLRCAALPEPNLFGPSAALLDGFGGPAGAAGWTVGMSQHPRLAGAPLLNSAGEVVGVVIGRRDDPQDKLPAVSLTELRQFLSASNALPIAPCGNSDPTGIYQVSAESE